jgi:hypothetical protein
LVTTGVDTPLVSSTDGTTWTPLKDQPPHRPDGIAHADTGTGTIIWVTPCENGRPPAADAVLRLADAAP